MKSFLTLLFIVATMYNLSAQKDRHFVNFAGANVVDTYSGNLEDISSIIESSDMSERYAQEDLLKQLYHDMSGVNINSAELDDMMDVSQTNYDTWMGVLESTRNNYPPNDLYVLRSIIMNLKAKM